MTRVGIQKNGVIILIQESWIIMSFICYYSVLCIWKTVCYIKLDCFNCVMHMYISHADNLFYLFYLLLKVEPLIGIIARALLSSRHCSWAL